MPLRDLEYLVALAVPASHRLSKRKVAAPQDIASERLLLLKDGHCLRDQAVAFCAARGGSNAHHSIATSIETLQALIRAGQGVTLIPRMAVDAARPDDAIHYLRLNPMPTRHIRLIPRKTSRLGRTLAQTFLARRSTQ